MYILNPNPVIRLLEQSKLGREHRHSGRVNQVNKIRVEGRLIKWVLQNASTATGFEP